MWIVFVRNAGDDRSAKWNDLLIALDVEERDEIWAELAPSLRRTFAVKDCLQIESRMDQLQSVLGELKVRKEMERWTRTQR